MPSGTTITPEYLNSLGLPPTIVTPVRTVTASTTVQKDTDYILLVNASSGAVNLSMPSVLNLFPGRKFIVKKIDTTANAVTITPYGSETIGSAATLILTKLNDATALVNTGSAYHVLTENLSSPEIDVLAQTGSYTGGAIASVVASLGINSEYTIMLRPGTWIISDDLAIPSNITLKVSPGALLQVATGKSVTGLKYAKPEWFGAVASADGSFDCTSAITQAISASKAVEFEAPPGYYYGITDTISIVSSDRRIYSHNKSEIRQKTNGKGVFSVTASNVEFNGLTISGSQFAIFTATEKGIYASGTPGATPTYISGIKVLNCVFSNLVMGIVTKYVSNFEISGNEINNMQYTGIINYSALNGRIHHNKIHDVTGYMSIAEKISYGICVTARMGTGTTSTTDPVSTDILIDNNDIKNVTWWHAIDAHGGNRIKITNNNIVSSASGIWLTSLQNDDITSNYQIKDCSVTGNTITVVDPGITSYGIGDYGAAAVFNDGTLITGNIISGADINIYTKCSYRTTITNNIIPDILSGFGIKLNNDFFETIVSENNIYDATSGYGIGFNAVAAASGTNSALIDGNVIDGANLTYGIYNIAGSYADVMIRHNRVKGLSSSSAYKNYEATDWESYFINSTSSYSEAGTGDLTTLILYQNSFTTDKGLRYTASGTKSGSNGNKTIIFNFGTTAITVCAAANNTNDWRIVADIWWTGPTTQRITWTAWSGTTVTQGYSTATEDITSGNLTLKMSATLVHVDDTVSQTTMYAEKL